MKKLFYSIIMLLFVSCSTNEKKTDVMSVESPKGTNVFQDNWENIAENYHFPEWFSDAKFGIFIHWGVYSVPAYGSEWYSRNMYQKGSDEYKHHIETYGPQDKFGYKDFIPMFKAEKFDADEWVKLFKEAGANGIAIAEPAAGLLSPNLIKEFSTPYVKKIRESVEDDDFMVLYHNCGSVIPLLDNIREINAGAYSIGNAVDIEEALKAIPQESIVTGNIDPAGTFRNGTPEQMRKETLELLERCSKYPNFVIGSGCDIPPMTPMENIQAFFDAVQEFYEGK